MSYIIIIFCNIKLCLLYEWHYAFKYIYVTLHCFPTNLQNLWRQVRWYLISLEVK